MSFVALDVETANSRPSSICALAIAFAAQGTARTWLLRPEPPHFDGVNVGVHGIRTEQIADAPAFAVAWAEIRPYLDGQIVIAHNAPFDNRALLAACRAAGVEGPSCKFICSMRIARAIWPGRQKYTLDALASYLKIPLKHHDPASDAAAALMVVERAMQENGAASLEEFLDTLRQASADLPAGSDVQPHVPLVVSEVSGKRFAFTGSMIIVRQQAEELVTSRGGHVTNAVSKNLDYLVVGSCGNAGSKLQKAQKLIAGGAPLRLLAEVEFMQVFESKPTEER